MNEWGKQAFSMGCVDAGMTAYFPCGQGYDDGKKDILCISHIIDHTGAPLVFLELMKQYQKKYNVFLVTMQDGNLKDEILEHNIPVFAGMPVQLKAAFEKSENSRFRHIWINTIICHGFVMLFQNTETPVFWWFHEPDSLFRLYYERMPELPLYSENIRIVAVSKLVQQTVFKYYHMESKLLHMPVTDAFEGEEKSENHKTVFFMPARFQRTKGHDVIAKVILNLSDEYRSKAEFLFAGSVDEKEPDYYELMHSLSRAYPDTVKILGELTRDEVYQFYRKCDCVMAPSRQDATPTTIVEAMMFERMCLCSDATGISQYLIDGVNAFIVKSEDENDLQRRVEYIVDHKEELDGLRKAGRAVYLQNFEDSVVWKQLERITAEEV